MTPDRELQQNQQRHDDRVAVAVSPSHRGGTSPGTTLSEGTVKAFRKSDPAGRMGGRTTYVRPHPFSSPAGPIPAPIGMPRGNTPPSPDVTMTVPVCTCWRYSTPCSSSSQTFGPSAPCGAAIPTTLPSIAMALARNSGCAQLNTTLECSSTLATNPTKPSGLTTAESGRTPSRLPAETMKLSGLVGSG